MGGIILKSWWKAAQNLREWIIAMQAFEDLHMLLLGGGVVLGLCVSKNSEN